MNRNTLSTVLALTGVAVLAACACGAGSGAVRTLSMAGMQMPDTVVLGASCGTNHSAQPLFIGLGALLVVIGISLRSLSSAALAAVGALAFAIGTFAAGPSMMNSSAHADPVMLGFGAYVIASILLIAAFLRAFKTSNVFAAGAAMTGMALATGCSCCMVTGAVTALIAGAGMPAIYNQPYVFIAGGLLMAVGLWRIGGIKPAVFVAAGVLITFFGQKLLALALPELISAELRQ